MSPFFPIPTDVRSLWRATGARDQFGRPETELDRRRWDELAAERTMGRFIATGWRMAATVDGWAEAATYDHEPIDNACTMTLQTDAGEFKAQILMRPNREPGEDGRNGSLGGGEVHVWGPDRLQIKVPLAYPGRQYFVDALVTCPHCHRGPNAEYFGPAFRADEDPTEVFAPVEIRSYSFAGRACVECVPALKAATEQPGWND